MKIDGKKGVKNNEMNKGREDEKITSEKCLCWCGRKSIFRDDGFVQRSLRSHLQKIRIFWRGRESMSS